MAKMIDIDFIALDLTPESMPNDIENDLLRKVKNEDISNLIDAVNLTKDAGTCLDCREDPLAYLQGLLILKIISSRPSYEPHLLLTQ